MNFISDKKKKCFNRNCEISILGLGPMLDLVFFFFFLGGGGLNSDCKFLNLIMLVIDDLNSQFIESIIFGGFIKKLEI